MKPWMVWVRRHRMAFMIVSYTFSSIWLIAGLTELWIALGWYR